MNTKKLNDKIESLPDDLKKQVVNFIEFLGYKSTLKKKPLSELCGKWEGLIEMKPDFDEPLEDFKEYME